MPSFWDYVHIGRPNDEHAHRNLQEGLFQIASQTCSILVQVNNTNNISYGGNATNVQYNNFPSRSDIGDNISGRFTSSDSGQEGEQRVVLLPSGSLASSSAPKPSSSSFRRPSRRGSARKLFTNYKHRLSTVLESGTQGGEDDFELWDQSQMLRSESNGNYKWNHGPWCKPSCIPITVILTLIVLVVLLPLLEHANDKALHTKNNGSTYTCTDTCSIQLVESIPEGLVYPNGTPTYLSTYDAWSNLIAMATDSIDIGSFYWTLRGADVYNHSSAWQGEKIFQQLLNSGTQRKIRIRIAQNAPTQQQPNLDTEYLIKRKAAEVRSVNFLKLLGGGVLHTKVWIVDEQHFYVGSANMDWRSLTQVKELGLLVTNCTCLAKDVMKIFDVYWSMGKNNTHLPPHWPEELSTKINVKTPLRVRFNGEYDFKTFLSSSPPPMSPRGRTQDDDAIIKTILRAEKFVHISVMDYFPLMIYSPKIQYWPFIDDALRKAAVENKVSVKLLISWWNHSRPAEDNFLRSLETLSSSFKGVDIQIRRFIVPSTPDQSEIPFGRVNHNKYMVTDNCAYVGTSNWSGDYFVNTAGIGFVLEDPEFERNGTEITIRTQLAAIFERDWNSPYAVDLIRS